MRAFVETERKMKKEKHNARVVRGARALETVGATGSEEHRDTVYHRTGTDDLAYCAARARTNLAGHTAADESFPPTPLLPLKRSPDRTGVFFFAELGSRCAAGGGRGTGSVRAPAECFARKLYAAAGHSVRVVV